ncbi:uncharacterized protein LTR77_007639 [Saxophila tyrrhenica]|uniref:Uncharacterized protein n=1 Tax=Saxophila tyrrhenica TaxID=1690608 RepID=A0AAV9P6F7_9PEZI|nr:hypothetical protein LTR77_007639 [Saxophila tyrrhenica]
MAGAEDPLTFEVTDHFPVYVRPTKVGGWVREVWKWADKGKNIVHCRHTGKIMCDCWKCISYHLTHSGDPYTTLELWKDDFGMTKKYAEHIGRPLELDISDPGGANGRIAQARGYWREWPTAAELAKPSSAATLEEHTTFRYDPEQIDEFRSRSSFQEEGAAHEGGTPLPGDSQVSAASRVQSLRKAAGDEYASGYEAGTDGERGKGKDKTRPRGSVIKQGGGDNSEPEVFSLELSDDLEEPKQSKGTAPGRRGSKRGKQ